MMKKVKTILVLACLAAMVLVLSACGNSRSGPIDWPDTGLAVLLPEPPEPKGEINSNSDNRFSAKICKVSESDFEDYVEACEDCGFTVEANKGSSSYKAFNPDGYKLSISYYSSSEYYTIYLDAPVLEEGQTFSWPTMGPATLLPEPSTNVGKIQTDSATTFSVYIGEFSSEEFESYVDECIEAGFDVDYSKTDTSYSAENEDGDSLSVSYEGFNVYQIRIKLAEEEETEEDSAVEEEEEEPDDAAEEEEEIPEDVTEAEEELPEDAIEEEEEIPDDAAEEEEEVPESDSGTAGESALVDGMRPEFKEAMDAYEAFYDQYVEFMAAYAADPTDMTLMTQYFSMLGEIVEMDEAFEAWDEDDMNSVELAYYLEVSMRCLQKLASVEY